LCAENDLPWIAESLKDAAACPLTERSDWTFDPATNTAELKKHLQVTTFAGFGFEDDQPCLAAAGGLFLY
jgi:DNA mismatch repair protein MutS